jgi:putative hydrolase of the HAD superfamily
VCGQDTTDSAASPSPSVRPANRSGRVLLSELEGVRKPSPLIYRRALEVLDLSGPECVFVDDHARNLPPAEAGIRTVHHTTDPAATAALLDSLLRDREGA